MPTAPDVRGRCEPAFARVRAALAEILAAGTEVGAALAVHVDGQPVIDLWAGHADAARTRAWEADTLATSTPSGRR